MGATTVASFALGDYEWIVAFETRELHRVIDLMRHLRGLPLVVMSVKKFLTGHREGLAAPIRALP